MTAIFRLYTDDGFVIAADGRMADSVSGTVVSNLTQKIFSFGTCQHLSFAFTGWALLGAAEEDRIVYSFIDQMSRAAVSFSPRRFESVDGYLEKCAARMQDNLESVVRTGTVELPSDGSLPGEEGTTIASVLIDGYFSGVPLRRELRFSHADRKLRKPEIETLPLDTRPLIYGSAIVTSAFGCDVRFEKYKTPLGHNQFGDLLSHAIEQASAFLTAASGPEAMELDPIRTKTIGGHIHIAVITPKEGFQWVPGFEPP